MPNLYANSAVSVSGQIAGRSKSHLTLDAQQQKCRIFENFIIYLSLSKASGTIISPCDRLDKVGKIWTFQVVNKHVFLLAKHN
jgi:hypothetical protein